MTIGYFNGEFISTDDSVIPIDERGHQFGDGVYEVIRTYNGIPFKLEEHLDRLEMSMKAIQLPQSANTEREHLRFIIYQGIEKSQLQNADVYIQITRGIATRQHLFPNVPASVSMTVRSSKFSANNIHDRVMTAMLHEDERWKNCYIKSLNLLPNILAKQTATDAGFGEAILIRDHYISEGTSSNVFIVKEETLYTPPLSHHILAGVTRKTILDLASSLSIPCEETEITPEDVKNADEVFITSTTLEVTPIIKVDDQMISHGQPGKITTKIFNSFLNEAKCTSTF
ncbi:D-amino-acid transaminase [Texcoconibacillus texcoconensis]|uniref:D-alanine aminotransferase n=1 Tax=Texcoconibacillus texcoconensis TaxID=1095777 RepID=A0A840QPI0_9BACI|nr:D-amino-acid transaminase [Texcoconibacillus texcoconensis]MBB5173241.1 D-alanine transaminase [Texcoconibacillus texcoconensis]